MSKLVKHLTHVPTQRNSALVWSIYSKCRPSEKAKNEREGSAHTKGSKRSVGKGRKYSQRPPERRLSGHKNTHAAKTQHPQLNNSAVGAFFFLYNKKRRRRERTTLMVFSERARPVLFYFNSECNFDTPPPQLLTAAQAIRLTRTHAKKHWRLLFPAGLMLFCHLSPATAAQG